MEKSPSDCAPPPNYWALSPWSLQLRRPRQVRLNISLPNLSFFGVCVQNLYLSSSLILVLG
jgi:hypothetical protein